MYKRCKLPPTGMFWDTGQCSDFFNHRKFFDITHGKWLPHSNTTKVAAKASHRVSLSGNVQSKQRSTNHRLAMCFPFKEDYKKLIVILILFHLFDMFPQFTKNKKIKLNAYFKMFPPGE